MDSVQLSRTDPRYPRALDTLLAGAAPARLHASGNLDLLDEKSLALFCSIKCPGELILQTYDLAQQLRAAGATVIGGFHSPMEQECLRILLRGRQPLILCPARSLEKMRVPTEYKQPLAQGRLLLLSPFAQAQRITAETSLERNRVVAALAYSIMIVHAAPQSQTEALSRELSAWHKPLFTLDSPANANLIDLGARPVNAGAHALDQMLSAPRPATGESPR